MYKKLFGLILLTVFVSTAFAKVHYEEAVSHPRNPRVCVIPETGSYVQLGSSKQMGRDDSSKCERVTCQRNGYDRYDTVQYSLYGVRSYDPAYGLRIKYETCDSQSTNRYDYTGIYGFGLTATYDYPNCCY